MKDDYFKNLQNQSLNIPFGGILGLSPIDDSSGPLFVDYLYKQNQISNRQFSILLTFDPA